MPKLMDSHSGKKKYVVGGRTKDRNVDDWQDRKQKQLLKEWFKTRKRLKKDEKASRPNKKTNS